MRVFIFLILIQFVINIRIQQSDYCFDSTLCSKEYHYKCSEYLCSKNELSCKGLKLWVLIKNHKKNEKDDTAFEKFFKTIKKCQNWNLNDICLNNAVCYQKKLLPERFWLIGKVSIRKQIKCKCSGKYSYKCAKDKNYCSIDEGACQRLNTEVDIKNC
jgi:hypothetical protein